MRAEWLYGGALGGGDFITKITKVAKEKGVRKLWTIRKAHPLTQKTLANRLWHLSKNRNPVSTIYRTAAQQHGTGFTKEIFKLLSIDIPIFPTTSDAYKTKAKRPSNSVYDISKLEETPELKLRTWQEALREYLLQKWKAVFFSDAHLDKNDTQKISFVGKIR
jgi:dTDP-4-dehydrorhamnose reductase